MKKRLPKNSCRKCRNGDCKWMTGCGKSWTITSSRGNQGRGDPGLWTPIFGNWYKAAVQRRRTWSTTLTRSLQKSESWAGVLVRGWPDAGLKKKKRRRREPPKVVWLPLGQWVLSWGGPFDLKASLSSQDCVSFEWRALSFWSPTGSPLRTCSSYTSFLWQRQVPCRSGLMHKLSIRLTMKSGKSGPISCTAKIARFRWETRSGQVQMKVSLRSEIQVLPLPTLARHTGGAFGGPMKPMRSPGPGFEETLFLQVVRQDNGQGKWKALLCFEFPPCCWGWRDQDKYEWRSFKTWGTQGPAPVTSDMRPSVVPIESSSLCFFVRSSRRQGKICLWWVRVCNFLRW